MKGVYRGKGGGIPVVHNTGSNIALPEESSMSATAHDTSFSKAVLTSDHRLGHLSMRLLADAVGRVRADSVQDGHDRRCGEV